MDYKSRFNPVEVLRASGWTLMRQNGREDEDQTLTTSSE
jgi:hypothetical protein